MRRASRALSCALLASVFGCAHTRALITHDATLRGERARVHMTDGRLYVLRDWTRTSAYFQGTGEQYDLDRRLVDAGRFTLPAPEVAEVEESHLTADRGTRAVIVLVALSAVSAVVAGLCLAAPDVHCFGSSR